MKNFFKIIWQGKIKTYRLFTFAFIFDLLFLDQVSKYWVRFYLESPINITNFFKIVFVENRGVAFSLPINEWFIFLLAFCVVIYLGNFLWKKEGSGSLQCGYIFIISGAVGNVLDRIFYGAVTDFLSFWSFPIFNLADSFIFLGVCFICWDEFMKK